MKKLIAFAIVGFMLPMTMLEQNSIGSGNIEGENLTNKVYHDFSAYSRNPNVEASHGNKGCRFCHTSSAADGNSKALWNRKQTPASYTIFQALISINSGENNCFASAPDGTSKLCLSCHDGLVSINVVGQQNKTVLGSDLSKHHPISVDYNCCYNYGLGDLRPTSWVYYASYDPVSGIYAEGTNRSKTVASRLDAAGKVQCTSCHCVHGNSEGYLLCMNNKGSLLCLVCHNN